MVKHLVDKTLFDSQLNAIEKYEIELEIEKAKCVAETTESITSLIA